MYYNVTIAGAVFGLCLHDMYLGGSKNEMRTNSIKYSSTKSCNVVIDV